MKEKFKLGFLEENDQVKLIKLSSKIKYNANKKDIEVKSEVDSFIIYKVSWEFQDMFQNTEELSLKMQITKEGIFGLKQRDAESDLIERIHLSYNFKTHKMNFIFKKLKKVDYFNKYR